MHTKAIVASAAMLLAGCTHVSSMRSQDVARPADGYALIGATYALPAIQYEVDVSRALDDCDADGVPKFVIVAASKDRMVAGESFDMDPSSLSSIFKTSSVSLEKYEDLNTLKAFNASADDKTADIAVALARTGIALAGLPSGGMGGGILKSTNYAAILPAPLAAPKLTCSAEAKRRLETVEAQTAAVKAITREVTERTTRLARLRDLAQMTRFDRKAIARATTALDDLEAAEARLAAAQEALGKATGALAKKDSVTWPTLTTSVGEKVLPPQAVDLQTEPREARKFCSNFIVSEGKETLDPAQLKTDDDLDRQCRRALELVAAQVPLQVRLVPEVDQARGGSIDLAVAIKPKRAAKGLFYREPVLARLVVEGRGSGSSVKPWRDEPRWVPQLGELRFLPFASGPFESETLSLALRKDGRVEKLTYESKEAALARAASAAADISEKVRADLEKREDRRRADEKYARENAAAERADEIAKQQYQLDLLAKNEARIKAESEAASRTEAAQLAALNSEIAMTTAQINRLKLTREYAAMQAPPAVSD